MAAGGQKDECDFYKALCTIRGTDGKTKGIACAVDIDGKKNKNEVVLVTWKGCNGEGKNSVKTVHRYSRNKKNPKDYQLEPSDGSILNRGNFSLIRCACGNDKWGVRLSPKYLKEEEQKADFLVYTVDPDCYRSLTLKYDESTNVHRFDIKEEEEHIYANLILRGAPIIQGEKYCVGVLTEDEEGKVSPLFITEGVFDQPEFTKHPQSQTVKERSKSVTFSCDTDSNPALTFLWTKDGIPLNVTTNPRYSLSDDKKQLRIKDVNKTDRGEYKCVVQKGANTINSTDVAMLTVEYQPEFTEHPQSQTLVQGSSVTFSSDANGVPEPTFSWTKDGSAVTADNRIRLSADNKVLSITNVNRAESGEYRCVATNSVETVNSNAATLTVHYQPEFTEHPQSKTLVQGSRVTFSSDANGVPEPTFSWTKDGSAVTADNRIRLSADNKELSLTNVNGTDSGEYRCVATNGLGAVNSNAATLTIHYKSEALGHDTVDAQNKPTENQRKKLSFKVTKIPYVVLSEVCKMMNIKDYLNYKDFRWLAEKIGLGRNEAELFDQRSKNPTEDILKEWARKSYEEATVGKLIELLKEMERMDAVKELEDWVNKESS